MERIAKMMKKSSLGRIPNKEEYLKLFMGSPHLGVSQNSGEDDFSSNAKEDLSRIKAAYEQATKTREFEIKLYWERAKYFWAFIISIYVAYYNVLVSIHGGWFVYSDSSLGGNSRIKWPVETGNEYDDKALDPVIEHCNGLCGEFVLGDSLHFNDSSYQKPFIGVGFNVTDSDTVGGDITGWGGISIAYSGPAAIIELVPENEKNYLESDNYFANIPRQGSINAIKISWNDFNSWASLDSQTEVPLNEFLKKVVAIRIYTQLEPGSIESFKIMAIGSYNTPVYY